MNEPDIAWQWFSEALASDIEDTQGGTTPEGVHLGVMAGTLEIITRYFAGLSIADGTLKAQPNLPKHWPELHLSFSFRGVRYRLEAAAGKGKVREA